MTNDTPEPAAATRGPPRRPLSAGHWASAGFFTLFFALTFAAPYLFSDAVPGDIGDARFNMYVLEHGYRWLTGRTADLVSAPIFYPYPYTLFFSDSHVGTAPVYALFRASGFNEYRAFALWAMTGFFLTLWTTYFVFQRLGFGPLAAGVAASMFAFSLPSLAQISHSQLFHRFAVPLAMYSTWNALRYGSAAFALSALTWLLVQLLVGIYLGVFLALLMFAFVVAYARANPRNLLWVCRDLASDALRMKERMTVGLAARITVALVLGCAVLVVLGEHWNVSRLYGVTRPWAEIESMLPRPASYFLMDWLPYWERLSGLRDVPIPVRHEHNLFVGLGALSLFVIGTAQLLSGRHVPADAPLGRMALFALLGLVALVTIVGGFSLYRLVYLLPGLHSIRSVTRIMLVLAFPMAVVIAIGLSFLLNTANFPQARALAIVLSAALLLETALTNRSSFSGREDEARVAGIAAAARAAAGTVDRPILEFLGDGKRLPVLAQVDAMMVAQRLGWPTINGNSGFFVDDPRRLNCNSAIEHAARYADWSLERGRPMQGTIGDLVARTVTVGDTLCPPIPNAESAGLKVSRGEPAPKSVAPSIVLRERSLLRTGDEFVATFTVTNDSDVHLAKHSTAPLGFAWRFVQDADRGGDDQWDTRQAIVADLPPGGSNTNLILAKLPARPGRYWLQVSLVAEYQFWFHTQGMKILTFAQPIDVPLMRP